MMVSAVRAAIVLPLLFLAVPAGVIADRIDRRRLLIATQIWLLLTAATLAILTKQNLVTPTVLLLLTGSAGLGMVLHTPSWQASIPELVPRDQLTSAIALGSISFNLARAAGPALGGLLVAWIGAWSVFAINAGSFAGVLGVLYFWRREGTESAHGLSFFKSMRDGLRFVSHDSILRHTLLRVLLYVTPASAVWSLLPLVARELLGWTSAGYGLLVGAIGAGAVLAAGLMPQARYRWGMRGILTGSHILSAVAFVTIALLPTGGYVTSGMLLVGAGWMMCLTTLNSTAQMALPHNFRARGMACYLTSFSLAMGGGSLLWGFMAKRIGVSETILVAGITMACFGALAHYLCRRNDRQRPSTISNS